MEHGIAVGQTLVEGGPYPQRLGAQFVWRSYCLCLVVYVPDLQPADFRAVVRGPCQIGLFDQDGIMIVLAHFLGLVFEAPWSFWREPMSVQPSLDVDLPPTHGFGLDIILVDGTSGVVTGIRRVGLGHMLSIAMLRAAIEQRTQPRDQADVSRAIKGLEAAYPTFWPHVTTIYEVGTPNI